MANCWNKPEFLNWTYLGCFQKRKHTASDFTRAHHGGKAIALGLQPLDDLAYNSYNDNIALKS